MQILEVDSLAEYIDIGGVSQCRLREHCHRGDASGTLFNIRRQKS